MAIHAIQISTYLPNGAAIVAVEIEEVGLNGSFFFCKRLNMNHS
jgi:hypothetical protein